MSQHAPTPDPAGPQAPRHQPASPLCSLHVMLMVLVALALVPVLALSFWGYLSERDHERTLAVERTAHAAGMIAEDLAQETRYIRLSLGLMAASPEVRACTDARNAADCTGALANFAKLAPEYLNLHLVRPGEPILASARPLKHQTSLASNQAVMDALHGQAFSVGVDWPEDDQARGTGDVVVTYAAPVRDARGDTALVLAAQMAPTQASKAIRNAGMPEGTSVILAGLNGRIILRIPDAAGYAGKGLPENHASLIRKAVSQSSGWDTGLDGVERYYVLRRLDIGGEAVCYVRV
ncbi:MAG: hypothetical protein Q7I92_05260, partial [Humidesulfovibrio sp.]|nr:hypothetical protein [Humidesulfovibrio sp.]